MTESLPFPNEPFDMVVSQFSLMFFTTRKQAICEMLRVLTQSGYMVVAIWDSLKNIPAYAASVALLDQLALLKSEGYNAVINLLPNESEYAIEKESSIVESQGIIYEYIPVGFSAPSEEDYREFESKLKALSGKKIMMHCAANYRVSAFYSICANAHLGWSEHEPIGHIGSIWVLNEHPIWDKFVSNMLRANNG
ncbi:MAG: methyltransferase domain-containing protein [Pseudomonadales bacterium]|nr:methyltransferase domain-containing protein [Pseudomonadales bacterium]